MAENTYIVQKGDTLGAIAKRLGTTVAKLVALNKGLIKDPNKISIGWELKTKEGPPPPPPAESGGPKKGPGGKGFRVTYDEKAKDEQDKIKSMNPTSRMERKEATAKVKEDKWRAGKEDPVKKKKEVLTPVEVYTPPPPTPPPPPVPFSETTFGKLHSYLDPVAVLSGHAGEAGFKPSVNDIAGTALFGLGGNVPRPAAPAPRVPMPRPGGLGEAPPAQGGYTSVTGKFYPDAGGLPESPVSGNFGDISHTGQQLSRFASAKQRPSSEWFDPWQSDIGYNPIPGRPFEMRPDVRRAVPAQDFDPHAGMSNVRPDLPYEPTIPPGERLSPMQPKGSRELDVDAPEPMVVRAQDLKTVEDVRNALRSASDNTVVIDGASDLGFVADRVLITRGRGGRKIDPEKVLDSVDSPVLTQGMFARVLKHLGFGGG